jgi:hypothetical protein
MRQTTEKIKKLRIRRRQMSPYLPMTDSIALKTQQTIRNKQSSSKLLETTSTRIYTLVPTRTI